MIPTQVLIVSVALLLPSRIPSLSSPLSGVNHLVSVKRQEKHFSSWRALLESEQTRTGRNLQQIPSFVLFCQNHAKVARQFRNKTGLYKMSGHEDLSTFIPNQLNGGAQAGPLAKLPTGQLVRAACAYSGLTSQAIHSCDNVYRHGNTLKWAETLVQKLPLIQQEVRGIVESRQSLPWQPLRTKKGAKWSAKTGWSHLALCDNFSIQDKVAELFPTTAGIVVDTIGSRLGPRLIAIAKQAPNSGIPTHFDYMNWMLTLHIPLFDTNESPSSFQILKMRNSTGMVVDGHTLDWTRSGVATVIDTTYPHSTFNTHPSLDTFILLVDFWHPDLSTDEIDALRIFLSYNSNV